MPPLKSPKALRSFAERLVFEKIIEACAQIQQCYPVEYILLDKCKQRLTEFNKSLKLSVPFNVLDKLCSKRHQYKASVHPIYLLAALVRPNMRVLEVNEEDMLYVPEAFLVDLLKNLKLLTVLNLKRIGNDKILQVVCDHCKLLKDFRITSYDNITDNGLMEIVKLTNLTTLYLDYPADFPIHTINGYIPYKLSPQGLKKLIGLLPRLEVLRNGNDNDIKRSFPLVFGYYDADLLTEALPNMKTLQYSHGDLARIIHVFPSIQDLTLNCGPTSCDIALDQIVNSNWKLHRLNIETVNFYPNIVPMENLFRAQGTYITHLCLDHKIMNVNQNLNFSLLVGLYCPNVIDFTLCTIRDMYNPPTIPSSHPIYTKLTSLNIIYSHTKLHFFLKHAPNIKNLTLNGDLNEEILTNQSIIHITSERLFQKLETLQMNDPFISLEIIVSLIDSCPFLKRLLIKNYLFKECLLTYIAKNNLDLKLHDDSDDD